MTRTTRWFDYITFNIYFLGLTTLSQTNGTVIPLLIQHFMGEAQKGEYFGKYRLWTLMVALLAQAFFGMLSDRSRLRWGRRRPFIMTGTLLDVIFVVAIALTAFMAGYSEEGGQNAFGFWLMFGIAILLQISSNIAHSAEQGVMPDLVPEEKRGRFSSVKAMLELPIPLILVFLLIKPIFDNKTLPDATKIAAALGVAVGVVVLSMLVAMLIPEKRREDTPPPLDWQPFLRLLAMTAIFTAIILGAGWVSEKVEVLVAEVQSLPPLMLSMGLVGLAGMAICVALGVWLSVRISIGEEAVKNNPSFTWWVVNRLAFLVGATNLSTFVVYYFQARLGYEKTEAGPPAIMLQLFVGVFILISALPAGWLSDRFGKKRMAMISGIIGAAGTAVALSVPSLPVIYVGGSIIGIATGLFFTANWALGTVLVPKEEAGRYLGISNLAGAGAGAVGAYIGGPIADFVSARGLEITSMNGQPTEGLGYMLLFGIYGVIFLLSALALLKVKEHEKATASVQISLPPSLTTSDNLSLDDELDHALDHLKNDRPEDAMRILLGVLERAPNNDRAISQIESILYIEQNNLSRSVWNDPLLDRFLAQCSRCGVSWAMNPLVKLANSVFISNPLGGKCPICGKVFCRNCASSGGSLFCPEHGSIRPALELLTTPNGRRRTIAPRSRPNRLAHVVLLREPPPPPRMAGYIQMILETNCSEAFQDNATIYGDILENADPNTSLAYLSIHGKMEGWPNYLDTSKYEIVFQDIMDADGGKCTLVKVYEK